MATRSHSITRFLLRWAITAAALWLAVYLVPGISLTGDHKALALLIVALVLGLINAFVRPILKLLSCGLIVLTLGLFLLVINGLLLWLAGYVSQHWLHLGFHVSGFGAAFVGALIVSVVSFIVSMLLGPRRGRGRAAW